jgi:hypothetical protein
MDKRAEQKVDAAKVVDNRVWFSSQTSVSLCAVRISRESQNPGHAQWSFCDADLVLA